MDPYGQQENDEINYYLTEDVEDFKSKTFEKMTVHLPDIGNNNLITSISESVKYVGIQAMNHLQDFWSLFVVIFFSYLQ